MRKNYNDTSIAEKSFSARLKAIRLFYCLSLREMADLLHYKSAANITFIENYPMVIRPSFSAMVRIQNLFGVSVDWLLEIGELPFNAASLQGAYSHVEERLPCLALELPMNQFPLGNVLQQALKEIVSKNAHGRLCREDQMALLFLLQYFNYILCKDFEAYQEGKQEEKYLYTSDKLGLCVKKHREYVPALFQLKEALDTNHNISVLSDSWSFLQYANKWNLL